MNRNIATRCVCFPSHIQVWVSCPLLWQQLSQAYRWWDRSFPHPLAAAPREWSQCRVQGRRCPQREWYPRHQMNLEEKSRDHQKHAFDRIKITQHVSYILSPWRLLGWVPAQLRRGENRAYGSCGRFHRRHWCGKEKHFQVPVLSELPSPVQQCPQHSEKLEPYCKEKQNISEANVWMLRTLSCRHCYDAHTLQACGTCRGSHSAHLAQVPCFHLGQLCRMGSSLQQLDFWSAH